MSDGRLGVLKNYFGYDSFRSGQETLIGDILSGRDVLGIMPTGAGKSVCFQVPALMMKGLTLIVSPLISLMKDQVNALTQSGAPAAFINTSLNERQISKTLSLLQAGAYKMVYIAPERLLLPDFLSIIKSMEISMLTVDEAHCISQWGQDFRPSYTKIPEFIGNLPERPVISAFTATATPAVREDIIDKLSLNDPNVLVTGFDRENLFFDVKKPRDKFAFLLEYLKNKKDSSGIVYCSTRAAAEDVCERLKQNGHRAARYHAGLPEAERTKNQDDFLYDRVNVIAATNAFGMGIDKSNVSFVIHYNMPKDIESYYQEAGRAGRDGNAADCILLYSGQDVHTNKWLIENPGDAEYPDKEAEETIKERNRERLRIMTFYCSTNDCLRRYILKYFGETPQNYCGNCGSCLTNFETADVTEEAKKIISCAARMKERFGVTMIIDTLRGSKNEKVIKYGFDRLSTYGISTESERRLRDIINHLVLRGYLIKTDSQYPVINLGPNAKNVLNNGEKVTMKLSKNDGTEYKTVSGTKQTGANAVDNELFASLKKLRHEIAGDRNVPAFIILHDSSLTDMCKKLPRTRDELLGVSGIGKAKAEAFGDLFINAVTEYLTRNSDGNC